MHSAAGFGQFEHKRFFHFILINCCQERFSILQLCSSRYVVIRSMELNQDKAEQETHKKMWFIYDDSILSGRLTVRVKRFV